MLDTDERCLCSNAFHVGFFQLPFSDSYEPQPGPSGISQSVPVSEQSVHDDMIGPSGSLHVSSEPETSLSGTAPSTLTLLDFVVLEVVLYHHQYLIFLTLLFGPR